MKYIYHYCPQSKNLLTIFFSLTCIILINAQVIYISSIDEELFRLDLNTCEYEFIVNVQEEVNDLSFHPNGNLYGLSGTGNLYEIDTLTGQISFIHDFDNNFFSINIFNSLTIAGDGTVFATGTEGELWSYNISTGTEIEHGDIGFNATGDLTFIDGELYVAVTEDRIVLVDVDNPPNSSVALDGNITGDIFGIVSFAEDCSEINTYAITDINSSIYQINLADNSFEFICQLDIDIGGGASTFEFLASDPIIIQNINQTNPDCNTDNGSISVDITGGIGQIDYTLDGVNFQTTDSFTDLPSGMYTLTINDENGCTVSEEIDLLAENAVQITDILIANTSCESTNSSLTVTAIGGTGQLEYSIDGINFQNSGFFDDLSPNQYTLTVQDENDCVATENVEIGLAEFLSLSLIQQTTTSCNPDNGTIDVTGVGGTAPYQYSIDGINFQDFGFFDGLGEGDYTITVEDAQSCTYSEEFTIIAVNPTVILNVETIDTSCGEDNASILIDAIGGSGALQYSVNGSNYQVSSTFENLAAGEYTIYVKDENDCIITSDTLLENSFPIIINDIDLVLPPCNKSEGEILLEVEGGTGELVASINGGSIQPDFLFDRLPKGDYEIIITDEVDCTLDTLVSLTQVGCTIYVPNVFTPDNDGINDRFRIFPYRNYEEQFTVFRIFNRWGALVYEAFNFDPETTGWDGRFREQDADIGVYVYYIEAVSENGEIEILKGDITLVR